MGYKEINNPCDLIVYRNGTINLFECKAIHGNTLNFKSHVRMNQWESLLKYSSINGLNAGIIVWFIDLDKTFFINIQSLDLLKSLGNKSFNGIKDLDKISIVEIKGKKKKIFFEYDLDNFLKEIEYGK